ncbi:MAG: hypothetical protein WB579_08170 [Bryobacteraceae bacterium]
MTAIGLLTSAAERRSWNKVQYIGGTLPIKTSPYDWNTTVTITSNPDRVVLTIAPSSVFGHQLTERVKPSQITAVVSGPGAWQRVADVSGAHLPSKRPTLFGMLLDYAFVGIIYRRDDDKPAAVLLNSVTASAQICRILEALTGKPTEYAK